MKRIMLCLPFLLGLASSVSAQFYAENAVALLPPGTSALQYFIDQQLMFLTHLKTCEQSLLQVRSPSQPALLIVKEILGLEDGHCHVRTLTYPIDATQVGAAPTILDCHLSEKEIKQLTSLSEYEFTQNLESANAQAYDFSALSLSSRVALAKQTCQLTHQKKA